ncbi:MAG TPA: response regulator [Vicinamibacterales bacterium]|nr:response regulator [Vicinamibacterales bacterium]
MKDTNSRAMAGRTKARTPPPRVPERRQDPTKRQSLEVDGFSDDYLSVVAHDLRGSLNSIIGWAELIKRKALNESGNVRAGETIIRQAKQQLELINEVVDTWRLLSGNLQLKLAPVDAKELVNTAAYAAKEASTKSVELDFKLEALPAPLLADGARLRQAFIGLFNSAIHFAPEKGTVEIRLRPSEKGIAELTVHDAGVGVDADALPYLFSRQRPKDPLKQSARAKYGRGLGLIRDIIDLHGGTIRAETDGESGMTFRVTLPLQAAPSAVRVEKVREVKETSRAEVRSRLAGTRVLIVDDDPDAREVVGAILRHYGASVIVATSVSTALVALRREHVDVLVADLGMPIEDGYDLIRHVRSSEMERVARLPAAALTAYTTEEDRDRVLAAGFQFHLAKPVDPAVLVATVERLRSETLSVH